MKERYQSKEQLFSTLSTDARNPLTTAAISYITDAWVQYHGPSLGVHKLRRFRLGDVIGNIRGDDINVFKTITAKHELISARLGQEQLDIRMKHEMENSDIPKSIHHILSIGHSLLMTIDWGDPYVFEYARNYFSDSVITPIGLIYETADYLQVAQLYNLRSWYRLRDAYSEFISSAIKRNTNPIGGRDLITWVKTNFPETIGKGIQH